MKTKLYLTLSVASIMAVGGIVAALQPTNHYQPFHGNDISYELSLTSENQITQDGIITVNTENNNPILFRATGFSVGDADTLVVLENGGKLVNTTPVSGIGVVTVTFTKASEDNTLSLVGLRHPGQEEGKTNLTVLESGVSVPLTKTWDGIEFVASGEITIQSIQIHYSCVSRFEVEQPVRYEAEYSFHKFQSWDYGAGEPDFYKHDGSVSNGIYLGGIWNWVTADGSLCFEHYAFRGGEYKIRVRYRADNAGHGMRLKVNGADYSFTWGVQNGWGDWGNKDIPVTLNEGWNRIEFSMIEKNWVHLDYFEVFSDVTNYIDPNEKIGATSYYTEAENTNLWSTATATFRSESGFAYSMNVGCGFGDSDHAGFEINTYAMAAGEYEFKAALRNGGVTPAKLYVNSEPVEGEIINIPSISSLAETTICTVTLKEGTNQISLGRNGVWCNFDYFKLVKKA